MRTGTDRPHRVEAKQEGNALVVRRDQQVVERVDTSNLSTSPRPELMREITVIGSILLLLFEGRSRQCLVPRVFA